MLPPSTTIPRKDYMYYDPTENDTVTLDPLGDDNVSVAYYNFPLDKSFRSMNLSTMQRIFRQPIRGEQEFVLDPELNTRLKQKRADRRGHVLEHHEITYLAPYHPWPEDADAVEGSINAQGDMLLQLFNHVLASSLRENYNLTPRYSQFLNIASFYPQVSFYIQKKDASTPRFEVSFRYEMHERLIRIRVSFNHRSRRFDVDWTTIDERLRNHDASNAILGFMWDFMGYEPTTPTDPPPS
jgi:hypothetical protein